MFRSTFRRGLAPAVVIAVLATAAPANAQLPGLPDLPVDLPIDLPGGDGGTGGTGGLPGGGTGGLPDPGGLPGGGTGGLPDPTGVLPGGTGDLPGGGRGGLTDGLDGLTGGTGGTGGGTGTGGSGAAGGQLDASGPVIAGPSKAATVRVDSKGRFRLTGVTVTCPAACSVSVKVDGAGSRFVRRTYQVGAGGRLSLKKLKVSKKAQRALRSMRSARVVANLKASGGGASATRAIGLKLKPAKRR